ncbi:MAG: type II toxin-antitoxin system VapB family antitoxin [Methylococcaceae bacterium]
MQQQVTLMIDDDLFNKAFAYVTIKDKNQLIETALIEFINNHQKPKARNLLDLYGIGGISEDYDYKKWS